jgi:hypothetical protein
VRQRAWPTPRGRGQHVRIRRMILQRALIKTTSAVIATDVSPAVGATGWEPVKFELARGCFRTGRAHLRTWKSLKSPAIGRASFLAFCKNRNVESRPATFTIFSAKLELRRGYRAQTCAAMFGGDCERHHDCGCGCRRKKTRPLVVGNPPRSGDRAKVGDELRRCRAGDGC